MKKTVHQRIFYETKKMQPAGHLIPSGCKKIRYVVVSYRILHANGSGSYTLCILSGLLPMLLQSCRDL